MWARVAYGLILGVAILAVPGCGFFDGEEREPWRGQVEQACLAAKLVAPSEFIRPIEEIEGPGTCGLEHPFRVYALADGSVNVQPAARMGCAMTAVLNDWMTRTVQPAAMARFGAPVVEVKNMASYGCRTRNNRRGAKLSEHAFGNGLDIGAFILADGREVSVLKDWRKGPQEAQDFLREVHGGACGAFKTVLGPGSSDGFHENHLHLDLARHDVKGRRAFCRPKPVIPDLPPEPEVAPYEDAPMAYAPDAGAWPVARVPRRDVDVTGAIGPRASEIEEPPAAWDADD